MSGDATKGAALFKKFCLQCHSVVAAEGNTKQGPNLSGIVGREAATSEGYSYSSAMKKSGLTWDADTLGTYLTNPKKKVPGTKMVYAGMKKAADRNNLIAYLAEN